MQFFYTLFIVLACIAAVVSAKSKEEDDEALRDLYTGMAGLKEAASNPQMLAQLMRDLQVSDKKFEPKETVSFRGILKLKRST